MNNYKQTLEHDWLVLKWTSQHEDLALTPRNKQLCGLFFPALDTGCVRGWIPLKCILRFSGNNNDN